MSEDVGKTAENIFIDARKRLLKMHFESGVGHLGGNLSALDALLIIFHEFLGPIDSFILSKGHSAGALYIGLCQSDAVLETLGRSTAVEGRIMKRLSGTSNRGRFKLTQLPSTNLR